MGKISVNDVDTEISRLEEQITELKTHRGEVEKNEKRYQLLVGPASLVRTKVYEMPDHELAKKCRFTSLYDILREVNQVLGLSTTIPVEVTGKSIAEMVYICDYLKDEESLQNLNLQE
jgi:hypothetical protein